MKAKSSTRHFRRIGPSGILSRADVERRLGPEVAAACLKAGWLAPRSLKLPGQAGVSRFFAAADVEMTEKRLQSGEIPTEP